MSERASEACPCGKGPSLAACCGPVIDGSAPATTAEALMRSRYTAYVIGAIDHVVASHDPATREDVDRKATEEWSKQSRWLGLEIKATEAGGPDDERGVVEFVASFQAGGGPPQPHHERSMFVKKDEGAGPRWFYVGGEAVKPRPVKKAATVGRNEPCPCGSGKKFKKCHGAG